jgi:pyridoxamine 5'-phosphate oxidase
MNDLDLNENPDRLTGGNFYTENDPLTLFFSWYEAAKYSEINDPNAMTLATMDSSGFPNARIVLLKDVDSSGYVFYTNTTSAKGNELRQVPHAALVFHWKSLRRQVRVRGLAASVTPEEADAYFATRPRISQIGAWASQQSQPLDARATLEQAVAVQEQRFGDGPIPRPPHWSGYRITPLHIEFWDDRPFRLHERMVFTRTDSHQPWTQHRLYP